MSAIKIKTPEEIAKMRIAGQLASKILDLVGEIVEPGISTEHINAFIHEKIISNQATPATLNYKNFPKSCCTSVNEVVCHGIPSEKVILKKGDIINVDITVIKDGYHGDTSRMYFVGGLIAASKAAQTLVAVTKEALGVGIAAVKPGNHFGDIGNAIQKFIAKQKHHYGIVREYTGHGIGKAFHEPPQILHFGKAGTGDKMKVGMTFTIEPMINMGTWKTKLSKEDGWTVRTTDGKLSAQWEHTVAVTENGVEILTG